MTSYYVYVYLDPLESGKFKHPQGTLFFRPLYVGKGKGRRWSWLLNAKFEDLNNLTHGKMKNIADHGEIPFVEIFYCESEIAAFELENQFTQQLGLIIEDGLLCNMRHGGGGGFSLADISKEKLRQANLGMNNPNFGKKWTTERHEQIKSIWKEKKDNGFIPSLKQMQGAWNATKRTYLIKGTLGETHHVDDLSAWCKLHSIPLSTLRKALKNDGTVVSGKRRKSVIEGWKITYID